MSASEIVVEAGANIAFIKYWGNRGSDLNLPLNPSISMTLDECRTRTRVTVLPDADADEFVLGGERPSNKSVQRLESFLRHVREISGRREPLRIESENAFPTGCGIASSASGFAALALAASTAYGLEWSRRELSRLARRGSGSAARSIFGGFVELRKGDTDEDAFAEQLADEAHWPELRDVVAVVADGEKAVSSAEGHRLAVQSEMMAGRLEAVPERARRVREAIRRRDLAMLGEASEADAVSMHAVMMTSKPPLFYWTSDTLTAINAVREMRHEGIEAWFTIDAGPNVHVLTLESHRPEVERRLRDLGWRVISDGVGGGARVVQGGAS